MTKTEFKDQGIDDLRAAILDLYDDQDGSIAAANKTQLRSFVDSNWEHIDSQINQEVAVAEEKEEPDSTEEKPSEVEEPEEGESESEPEVLGEYWPDRPDPRTSLHTNQIPGPREGKTVIHEG